MKANFGDKDCSGIYQIRNTVNDKIYIGRTKCFYKRCHQYLYDFKERHIGHLNDYLYNSIVKYGLENFSFEVLEYCSVDLTPERELYWIKFLNTTNKDKGYNLRLDVNGKMFTSPETSERISTRLRKEWEQGTRDGHSDKLKKAWDKRDRKAQGNLMSKNLTKYEYHVSNVGVINYKKLNELGLKNSIASFHRTGSDIVLYKGYRIERKKVSNEKV